MAVLLSGEIVEDEVTVPTECASHFLESWQASMAHDICTPSIPSADVFSGPRWTRVGPEFVEGLFEQVTLNRCQVDGEKVSQTRAARAAQVHLALESQPSRFREVCRQAASAQVTHLVTARVVNGIREFSRDMKAIKDVEGTRCSTGDHIQIRFSYVGPDKLSSVIPGGRHHVEEAMRTFLGPFFSDSQQTPTFLIDLIHQRQVGVSCSMLNFINADGGDLIQAAVSLSSFSDPLHGARNGVPVSAKSTPRLLPGQLTRPAGQMMGECRFQTRFSTNRLRHLLNNNAVAMMTVGATHCIRQHNSNPPQGSHVERTLRQMAICRNKRTALRADRARSYARSNHHADAFRFSVNPFRVVYETLVSIDMAQYCMQMHEGPFGVIVASFPLAGHHASLSLCALNEAPPQAASAAQPLMPSTAGCNPLINRRCLRTAIHCRMIEGRPARCAQESRGRDTTRTHEFTGRAVFIGRGVISSESGTAVIWNQRQGVKGGRWY